MSSLGIGKPKSLHLTLKGEADCTVTYLTACLVTSFARLKMDAPTVSRRLLKSAFITSIMIRLEFV